MEHFLFFLNWQNTTGKILRNLNCFFGIIISGNKLKGFRFKRQHPIKYFIADFYCHKAKLIIEVDGGYHNVQEQYQYDRNRDYELEELGLSVLHFTNEEVVDNIEVVLEKIKEELTPKSPEGDFADARL